MNCLGPFVDLRSRSAGFLAWAFTAPSVAVTATIWTFGRVMSVIAFDHVAIPTAKPEEMLEFYRALGFSVPTLEEWRKSKQLFFSIRFGENKINVHAPVIWQNPAFTLRGHTAKPGCGDFCFVWSGTVEGIKAKLEAVGARIEEGPVERAGGRDHGTTIGTSLYTRDPDDNLLEFIIYRGEEPL